MKCSYIWLKSEVVKSHKNRTQVDKMEDLPTTSQAKPEPGTAPQTETEHINLKVTTQDGEPVHFKIKRTTPMQKLIDAFAKRQALDKATMRFTFDGRRISGTDTPNSLEMEDNDIIDVLIEQIGGH